MFTWLLVKVWGQVEHALEEGLREEYHLDALGQLPLPPQDSRVGVEIALAGDLVAEAAAEEQHQQAADLHRAQSHTIVVQHPLGGPQYLR